MRCKIRIVKEITDLFPRFCPVIGQIYDAEFKPKTRKYEKFGSMCIVNISGKRIIVREGEFEIVGV